MSKQAGPEAAPSPVIRIQASTGWVSLQLHELWNYRGLLYFLVWRDIKVRYKQTILGASWAIIQPVFTMIVFTLIFGQLARFESEDVPYAIFSFAALVPWTFFANALGQGANSLVGNANLIKKVYFPRLAIPIATVLSGLIDFGLAFLVLLGLMVWFKIAITINVLFLPLFVVLALVTALGVSLWMSALNVQFRDIRYVIPFLTQLWQYSSPVIYSSSIIPAQWRPFYAINPMVSVIDGFRWAMLGRTAAPGAAIWVSVASALLLLASGALYFRRVEKTFADMV